jgi:transposase-like protein
MPEVRWSSEAQVRAAVAESLSYAEVLRRLGLRAAGGNHRTVRKYVDEIWRIPTDHFDRERARGRPTAARAVPLAEILVEGSTYHRGHLKRRLLAEGLKRRQCEMCGQGEMWRGQRMALVLDHINGVHDDHRLENLRILCPNCNATLDTHCGKHKTRRHHDRACPVCAEIFRPANGGQRYCSTSCAGQGERNRRAQVARRRVARPPYEQLVREIETLGYVGVGRAYGVSDNAIRKWCRAYEAEARLSAGSQSPAADASPAADLSSPDDRQGQPRLGPVVGPPGEEVPLAEPARAAAL